MLTITNNTIANICSADKKLLWGQPKHKFCYFFCKLKTIMCMANEPKQMFKIEWIARKIWAWKINDINFIPCQEKRIDNSSKKIRKMKWPFLKYNEVHLCWIAPEKRDYYYCLKLNWDICCHPLTISLLQKALVFCK